MLVSIDDILTAMRYDAINVTVRLRNGSQQATTINLTSGQAVGTIVAPKSRTS